MITQAIDSEDGFVSVEDMPVGVEC